MRERIYGPRVESLLRDSPAVALVGPRQCGKTTLARELGGLYFDLELEADRRRLELKWDDLALGAERVILDEAQAAPEFFPRVRAAIDADRKRCGRFLLLGSVAPALMQDVAESLAGRLALLELTPFLTLEVEDLPWSRLWLCGGFPDGGILEERRYPGWQLDYLALLAQRDLPNWGLPAPPIVTERLMRMLAAEHGQRWNASKIGQALGLNYQTVAGYVGYLEGAYLVRRLLPFHGNLKKRLVKTPKVYWRDTGLLHALHGVRDEDDLFGRTFVGASYEGFVIEQMLGALGATGKRMVPYFFGTSDGFEVDLLLDFGHERLAVEVKLTTQPSREDIVRLKQAAELAGAARAVLVCRTQRPEELDGVLCAPLAAAIAAVCARA